MVLLPLIFIEKYVLHLTSLQFVLASVAVCFLLGIMFKPENVDGVVLQNTG
jgi:hypothetical protein